MSKFSSEGDLHVFFVASPVIQIVVTLLIKYLALPKERILCVVLRDADTSLIDSKKIWLRRLKIDRLLSRIFCFKFSDFLLRKEVESACDGFYLYCTWFDETVEHLVSSQKCKGHYYMEEGQLAYYQNKEFSINENLNAKDRSRRKSLGSNDYYYRSDAIGYFGLSYSSFPTIPNGRKKILTNYNDLLLSYEPKILTVKKVGVLPAPHRIDAKKIDSLLDVYIENIGTSGVIKFHPGFTAYPRLYEEIRHALRERGMAEEQLCGCDVLLEIEMLYSKKELYGARSSLSIYSKLFGSEYYVLDLPGYTSPIN